MADVYTPVNGDLLDAITTAFLTFIGWGGIEFLYFIVLFFVMLVAVKFVMEMR